MKLFIFWTVVFSGFLVPWMKGGGGVQGCSIISIERRTRLITVTVMEWQHVTKRCFNSQFECTEKKPILRIKPVKDTYKVYNEICCNGYKKSESGKCQPICDDCENGECHYPGYCSCKPGYFKNFVKGKCLPICAVTCINADCTGPHTCTCHEGYKFSVISRSLCVPDCPKGCTNGYCISAGTCACNTGYQWNSTTEVCEPICSELCLNGECTAPEICTCTEGYAMSDNSSSTCEAICSSGCPNGKCIDPNICECDPGYIQVNLNETSFCSCEADDSINLCPCNISMAGTTCIPICSKGCINGFCSAPNVCECHAGYMEENEECAAICNEPCENATCTAPDVCTCNSGYKKITGSKSICEPICDQSCIHGYCSEPHKCTCNPGYKNSNYETCVPSCERDCFHGQCIAPNMCMCHPGFKKDPNDPYMCNPICESECHGDDCNFHNLFCPCGEGYSRNLETGNCERICLEDCVNGYCKDSKCECLEGHKFRENSSFVCDPICDRPCVNGVCIGPNICECLDGYDNTFGGNTSSSTTTECRPVCDPFCENGICVEPNTCECLSGFEATTIDAIHICSPTCEMSCVNSKCILPNVCECLDGYTRIEGDLFKCEPICNPSCRNATCIEPNICDCLEGYEPDPRAENNETCMPICFVDCGNGTCIPPNKCVCYEGYYFDYVENMTCVLYREKNIKSNLSLTILSIIGETVGSLCMIFFGYFVYKSWSRISAYNRMSQSQSDLTDNPAFGL